MLDAEEEVLRVAVAQIRVHESECGEIRGRERALGKNIRDRLEIVKIGDRAGIEIALGQKKIVVAHVLPEVIEGRVVEEPVTAADDCLRMAERIPGEAEAGGEIEVVRAVDGLSAGAAGGANELRGSETRVEIRSSA